MQGKKTGGRQLATVNRLTRTCREAIEFASDALGGAERLAEWAAESPENEAIFCERQWFVHRAFCAAAGCSVTPWPPYFF
jgi:hypothetical protein